MAEKRKLPRRHLIYYLKAFDEESGNLLGHLADITVEGLMLVSENPIETEKDFQMKMRLPEKVGGEEYIHFSTRCLWCKSAVNPSLYDAGFKFLQIRQEDHKYIDNLIVRFGFRD